MNEKLQSVLGDDGMTELKALIATANAAPIAPWQDFLMGLVKSWQIRIALAIAALPELLPLISPELEQLMTAERYKHLMVGVGIVMVLLRFKTNQSLTDKGAKPAAP
jgi:hypothetical protein